MVFYQKHNQLSVEVITDDNTVVQRGVNDDTVVQHGIDNDTVVQRGVANRYGILSKNITTSHWR